MNVSDASALRPPIGTIQNQEIKTNNKLIKCTMVLLLTHTHLPINIKMYIPCIYITRMYIFLICVCPVIWNTNWSLLITHTGCLNFYITPFRHRCCFVGLIWKEPELSYTKTNYLNDLTLAFSSYHKYDVLLPTIPLIIREFTRKMQGDQHQSTAYLFVSHALHTNIRHTIFRFFFVSYSCVRVCVFCRLKIVYSFVAKNS